MNPVLVNLLGPVLHLRLNRPAVRNAINREMAEGAARAIRRLERDDDLRLAVIDGADGAFSSGMDFSAFLAGERPVSDERGVLGFGRIAASKPIIAAVEGAAMGAGFEAVLACDMVVAGRSAIFALPEAPRGMMAGGGGVIRLAQRLPAAIAAELTLTGRPLTADEAARWGLVNHVVPDGEALDAALTLATTIAATPPTASASTRAVLVESRAVDLATAYAQQLPHLERVLASGEAQRGARAFLERRASTPTQPRSRT